MEKFINQGSNIFKLGKGRISMAFWRKDGKEEEKKEDMEKIKQSLEEKEEGKDRKAKTTQTSTQPPSQEEKPDFAPLFVKIDRYKEVLQRFEEIKGTLNNLKDLVALLDQINQVKDETSNVLKKSIEEITNSLISLDEEFVRPEGTEGQIMKEPKSEGVKNNIKDLQKELKHLRSELQELG